MLKVCRLCLDSDIKLFNALETSIATNIENIVGLFIKPNDKLPSYLCAVCLCMLSKCETFINRCRTAHQLLLGLLENKKLTKAHVKSIDRRSMGLALPFTIHHSNLNTDLDFGLEKQLKSEDSLLETVHDVSNDCRDSDEDEGDGTDESHKEDTWHVFIQPGKNEITLSPLKATNKTTRRRKITKSYEPEYTSESEPVKKIVDLDYVTLINRDTEEQRQDLEARKESDNYKYSLFQCHFCFKGFIDEKCFNNHMEKHQPSNGTYVCDICQIRCDQLRRLSQHKRTVHEKKYKCKKCDHMSNTMNQAKFHELWHNGHTYHCDKCGVTFKKCTSHLTHMRLHHPTNYICHICSSSFLGQRGLNAHIKKMHKNSKVPIQEYDCKTCDMQFQSTFLMKKHIMTSEVHKEDNVYIHICKHCNDGFENESELMQHTKIHSESKKVKCIECNRIFSNHRRCAEHYRLIHLGITSSNSVSKTSHRSQVDPIICEICGLVCLSSTALVTHQRVHTGEKPFECSTCSKTFSIKQRLMLHERTHTGEKPYMCALCPKAFASKAAINRHALVHTGVKPYSCIYCSKSFSQSNSMKLHIRTVHHKLPALYKSKRGKAKHEPKPSETPVADDISG